VLAALKLAVHVVVNLITPYEFHRDELLYLAMGRHLRLWAMDFPPGIALLARGAQGVVGDSLFGFRLVPALAGTALVLLAALLARELGGGWRAQALAALGVIASPLWRWPVCSAAPGRGRGCCSGWRSASGCWSSSASG
jgi:hypothetical protein